MAERTERSVAMNQEHSSDAMSHRKQSLLALDIRAQKLGFVIFEGPTKLLDWGIRVYGSPRQRARNAVEKRVSALLDSHMPSALVARQIRVQSQKDARQLRRIINTIRREARRRSVGVHVLSATAVKKFFAHSGPKTKYEIASTLAEWFEDIAWQLPNKKKTWQSERFNMAIFDALATGVAFFGSKGPIRNVDVE
jgi:hypothetical protein